MQTSITMDVIAGLADGGFSLDELVYKVRELFEDKGLPGLVSLILKIVDEHVSLSLVHARPGSIWRPDACCDGPRYELLDRLDRRIRTGIGLVQFSWRRVRCRHCGKTLIPLREFLKLNRYQSKTSELERIVAEVVSEQSYRRSSRHMRLIGQIPVPRSTAHRWVMDSECDEIEPSDQTFQTLMADGSCYKRRPRDGQDNQGTVRLALGVGSDGQVQPLGAWTDLSWEQIGQELSRGLQDGQKRAQLLVSDAEQGLPQALDPLTQEQQRCHWHMVHDLDLMMRRQQAPKEERRAMQKELAGLIRLELPEEDVEVVSPQDRQAIEAQMKVAEDGIGKLVLRLLTMGCLKAADYVAASQKRLFAYVRFWLKHGIVNPRASSFIERLMREVARRLKRMAFGWSPAGAAKMTRIILKRFTNEQQWNGWWRKRLRLDENNVMLILGKIRTANVPQNLGR